MSEQRVAALLRAMDEAWERENWHVPLRPALEDLEARDASWQAAAGAHTIAQYVQHVAFWKAAALRELTGQGPRPEESGDNAQTFGDVAVDDDAWLALRTALEATQAALRGCVTRLADADLTERVETLLGGVASHDAYHTGEILQLRKLQGTWPPQKPPT